MTPRLEYLLRTRKDYIPPEGTDSDAVSLSEASEEEEDNYCHNGHAKDYPINHKFSEEARPYSHREFLTMWKKCEEFVGESTDDIESTRYVRGANKSLSPEDTDGQIKAQYGRLLPRAMKVRKFVWGGDHLMKFSTRITIRPQYMSQFVFAKRL